MGKIRLRLRLRSFIYGSVRSQPGIAYLLLGFEGILISNRIIKSFESEKAYLMFAFKHFVLEQNIFW